PAVRIGPPHRLEDAGREHVDEIVDRDLVVGVRPVHPLERLFAAAALVPPLAHLGDENRRVVVAPLRIGVELARAIEQRRDARDAIRAIERDLERADRVPRELVAERQVDDALMIAVGIEPLDGAQVRETPHVLRDLAGNRTTPGRSPPPNENGPGPLSRGRPGPPEPQTRTIRYRSRRSPDSFR